MIDMVVVKDLLLLLFLVLLFKGSMFAAGLKCSCNIVDSSCVNDVCEVSDSIGGCRINYQTSESKLFQTCEDYIFNPGLCPNTVVYNPGSSLLYDLCCQEDFCNTIEIFTERVREAGYSPIPWETIATSSYSPPPSPTSTSVPAAATPTTVIVPPNLTQSSSCSTSCKSSSSVIATTTSKLHTSIGISTTSTTTVLKGPTPGGSSDAGPPAYAIAVIAVLTLLLMVFILVIFIVVFLHFYPRHIIGAMSVESDGTPTCTLSTDCGDLDNNIFKEGYEGTTSGSGSGLPLLIQRSVAAQVTLKEVIGKGRFGEVRRGLYKGDAVAVKIFHTKEEASWNHEVEIYQTCLIRHPNILRFIAADNKDIGMSTQLWLITEYCDNGSLYDVLQHTTLSEDTVLKLCSTAASGLAHLHSDIIGTEGKPAIAHRDIKTRNILVKPDFTCCLADLGLSLRYYRDTDKVEEPPTKRVGTRRYLSPEILNDTMNTNNFDCFKRSDMYSFGLVMWETARRGICLDTYEEYQLPYFDLVSPDPTFEDMMKVVAIEKKRPTIPNRWSQSELFHDLAQLMEQCWHHDGEARVTALRVKKNLANLQAMKCKPKKDDQFDRTIGPNNHRIDLY